MFSSRTFAATTGGAVVGDDASRAWSTMSPTSLVTADGSVASAAAVSSFLAGVRRVRLRAGFFGSSAFGASFGASFGSSAFGASFGASFGSSAFGSSFGSSAFAARAASAAASSEAMASGAAVPTSWTGVVGSGAGASAKAANPVMVGCPFPSGVPASNHGVEEKYNATAACRSHFGGSPGVQVPLNAPLAVIEGAVVKDGCGILRWRAGQAHCRLVQRGWGGGKRRGHVLDGQLNAVAPHQRGDGLVDAADDRVGCGRPGT